MERYKLICLVVSLWGSALAAAEIPMVGFDSHGAPFEVLVPESEYRKNLKQAVFAMETSTLPVLQKKSRSAPGWMLRSAVVGLGVNTELGLGEVKFSILPRFRIGFSNAKEPSMP